MRRTDARLMLRRAAICRLLTPSAKSVSISPACLRTVGGRPWGRPSLRAWAIPAFTRSRRISRSNSAFCSSPQNAEYEREWIEFLITTMAYRARASECDAQMMATDTIVMMLDVRARMFCN
jgi:hypothetical protein